MQFLLVSYFGIPKGQVPLAGVGAEPHYKSAGGTAYLCPVVWCICSTSTLYQNKIQAVTGAAEIEGRLWGIFVE